MNLDRLRQILVDCTVQLRKGEVRTSEQVGPLQVVTFDMMPHESEARPDLVRIDMELLVVGVDKAKAENHRAELIEILRTYPERERLAGGPSYIEVGAEIGDQGAAFQLFALGEVLGLWKVVTPAKLRIPEDKRRDAAGSGYIMITGFRDWGD